MSDPASIGGRGGGGTSRLLFGLLAALLCVVALPLTLASCGGGGGSASVTCKSTDVKVGLSEYKFTPSHLTVPAGKTTFCLSDTGSMEHDMVIGNEAGTKTLEQSATLQPGEKSRFTVTVQSGTHMIWCSIPGHRAAGMVGTLTVS
ncbi:MAG: plastocyanin/azurin family copper-binding protein [Candidatus Dormibacteraceae bacterium]